MNNGKRSIYISTQLCSFIDCVNGLLSPCPIIPLSSEQLGRRGSPTLSFSIKSLRITNLLWQEHSLSLSFFLFFDSVVSLSFSFPPSQPNYISFLNNVNTNGPSLSLSLNILPHITMITNFIIEALVRALSRPSLFSVL